MVTPDLNMEIEYGKKILFYETVPKNFPICAKF